MIQDNVLSLFLPIAAATTTTTIITQPTCPGNATWQAVCHQQMCN
jgi:hypothetical protein